jgi:hypothetical protein
MGDIALRQRDWITAAEAFGEALEVMNENSSSRKQERVQALIGRGTAQALSGMEDAAIINFSTAFALDPGEFSMVDEAPVRDAMAKARAKEMGATVPAGDAAETSGETTGKSSESDDLGKLARDTVLNSLNDRAAPIAEGKWLVTSVRFDGSAGGHLLIANAERNSAQFTDDEVVIQAGLIASLLSESLQNVVRADRFQAVCGRASGQWTIVDLISAREKFMGDELTAAIALLTLSRE